MNITIPKPFADRGLTDQELVFAELVYRMRNLWGVRYYFRMYANDIKIIIGNTDVFLPDKFAKRYEGLIEFVPVDSSSWYIKPLWGKCESVEHELTDLKAIKIYCYVLGRTIGDKFEESNSAFDKYLVDSASWLNQTHRLGLHTRKEFL